MILDVPVTHITPLMVINQDSPTWTIGQDVLDCLTLAARNAAAALTAYLQPVGSGRSDNAVGDDGSLGLLWRNDLAYAYVDVTAEGNYHYYYELPSGQSGEAVVEALADVPRYFYDAVVHASNDNGLPMLLPLRDSPIRYRLLTTDTTRFLTVHQV